MAAVLDEILLDAACQFGYVLRHIHPQSAVGVLVSLNEFFGGSSPNVFVDRCVVLILSPDLQNLA